MAQLLATVAGVSEGPFLKFHKMIFELRTVTNTPFEEVARPLVVSNGSRNGRHGSFWAVGGFRTILFSKKRSLQHVIEVALCIRAQQHRYLYPVKSGERVRNLCQQGYVLERILREKEVVMRALWNDEAKGVYEESEFWNEMLGESEGTVIDECNSDGMECVDDLLERIREDVNLMTFDELLDSEYPNFHGTGLYISVARTNHSWKPNVSMDFNEGNAAVSCTAIRDIHADDELQMSFISNPAGKNVSHRKSQLADYLFLCNSELCSKHVS